MIKRSPSTTQTVAPHVRASVVLLLSYIFLSVSPAFAAEKLEIVKFIEGSGVGTTTTLELDSAIVGRPNQSFGIFWHVDESGGSRFRIRGSNAFTLDGNGNVKLADQTLIIALNYVAPAGARDRISVSGGADTNFEGDSQVGRWVEGGSVRRIPTSETISTLSTGAVIVLGMLIVGTMCFSLVRRAGSGM